MEKSPKTRLNTGLELNTLFDISEKLGRCATSLRR